MILHRGMYTRFSRLQGSKKIWRFDRLKTHGYLRRNFTKAGAEFFVNMTNGRVV